MRERLEYYFVLFVIKITKILPLKFCYFLFEILAILLFFALKSRRNLTIKNLQNALNLSQNEAKILAKKCFKSIGRTACESILIFNNRFDFEKMIINADFFRQTFEKITAKNSGIIIITAHFGNWEFLSNFAAILGFPQLVIGREGNNQLIETRLTRPSREKFGNILAYKHEAMAKMVRHLKGGGIVGILPDINAGGGVNGVRTRFFGRECWTTKAVGLLAEKFHYPVYAMFLKRQNDGPYEFIFCPVEFNLSGEKESDIKMIAQKCNDTIESVIKTAPQQWFFVHNRWRDYE